MALNESEMAKIKELLAGVDGKLIQAYADNRVWQARKTIETSIGIMPNATARLKAIEDAAAKSISELKMENLTLRKCFEKQIDPDKVSKLGMQFQNEKDLEEKLNLLKGDIELRKNKSLNELLAASPKPQAGQGQDTPLTEHEKWISQQSPADQIVLRNNKQNRI